MKKLKRIPKHNLGNKLLKAVIKSTAKVFNPTIKDYSSKTEMFLDILDQAKQQKIPVDRSSKLYKQIQDELPGAREYYKTPETKRLYRVENLNLAPDPTLEGITTHKDIRGHFFTDNPNKPINYLQKSQKQEGSRLKYVDVNNLELEKLKALNHPIAKNMDIEGSEDYILNPNQYNIQEVDLSDVDKITGNFMTRKKAAEQLQDKINSLKRQDLTDEELADGLYLSTKTEQAQKGLKDSKVQDLVYHGSASNVPFEEFRLSKSGKFGPGIYSTPNKTSAEIYAGENKILPLFVNMKSPNKETISLRMVNRYKSLFDKPDKLDFFDVRDMFKKKTEQRRQLKDSIIGDTKVDTEYVVKTPNQIKSLFRENLGKWDWTNPNIHKAIGAGVALGIGASQMKKGNRLKLKRK